MTFLLEREGERHAEAGCFGRREQLFGVRARAVLEA